VAQSSQAFERGPWRPLPDDSELFHVPALYCRWSEAEDHPTCFWSAEPATQSIRLPRDVKKVLVYDSDDEHEYGSNSFPGSQGQVTPYAPTPYWV
jgi:hypothetical protein